MSESEDAADRWQRLSRLFEELLDLDDDGRAQRLGALEQADPETALKLRRMLEAHRSPPATLDADWRVAMEPSSPFGAEAPGLSESPADRSGERIDEYQLIRRVGRGGMGEVYLAERTGGDFAQRVALKLLRRGIDTEDVIRRFAQERSILARLEHPGIARLIDGGVAGEGLPFLVMEFVEGEPLTAYARAHALDVEARLRLLIAVCEAVDFAHRRLVVHRDLKPSNVLVTADGSVKLLDFGIAKLLDAEAGDDALTNTGMRVLSPAYAAPEQFLGEPIGTATDVYALGVLLFELLTGELPHQRNSRSLDVLAQNVTGERVEKPSVVLRRQSHTETARRARRLEGDLDTIVLTALKREPERRYGSAAAFAQDLRAYLDGRPIAARPDTFGYRAGKFVRRNRIAVGSASVVLLAVLTGLGIALWQTQVAQSEARRADAQTRLAQHETARAEAQLLLAERTRTFVVKLFTELDPMLARDGQQLTAEQLVQGGLARLDTELADAPAARAELRIVLARALGGLRNFPAAIPLLEKGIAELRAVNAEPSAEEASALNILSTAYRATGRLDLAERAARDALAMYERLPGDFREDKIRSRTVVGNLAYERGDREGALAIHLANLADRESLFGKGAVESAVDHNNLSAAYAGLDRWADSEREARETLRLLRADPEAPRARQAWALHGIANTLLARGRYAEAEAVCVELTTLLAETLPPDHSMQGAPITIRARIAMQQGRYAEGAALFARVARLYEQAEDPTLVTDAALWGKGLLDAGQFAAAEAKLAYAASGIAKLRGENAVEVLRARAWRGQALARMGRVDEGLALARAAIAGFETQRRIRGTFFADSALALADALRSAGRDDEAEGWQGRGVDALAVAVGEDHRRVVHLRAEMAVPAK